MKQDKLDRVALTIRENVDQLGYSIQYFEPEHGEDFKALSALLKDCKIESIQYDTRSALFLPETMSEEKRAIHVETYQQLITIQLVGDYMAVSEVA